MSIKLQGAISTSSNFGTIFACFQVASEEKTTPMATVSCSEQYKDNKTETMGCFWKHVLLTLRFSENDEN